MSDIIEIKYCFVYNDVKGLYHTRCFSKQKSYLIIFTQVKHEEKRFTVYKRGFDGQLPPQSNLKRLKATICIADLVTSLYGKTNES